MAPHSEVCQHTLYCVSVYIWPYMTFEHWIAYPTMPFLVHKSLLNLYWHGIHLYSIVITWQHFGKPEIVAVINNPILRASMQIRQLLTGRTTQSDQRTDQRTIALGHPPRARSMWSRIRERLEGREEGDCNLIPAFPSPWHQHGRRSTGSWPPAIDEWDDAPPPAGSDNNSQLSITLTFLRISLSSKLTERTSRLSL